MMSLQPGMPQIHWSIHIAGDKGMTKTGELARLFDIDRTTLNYYVKKGLIQPDSGKNKYHTYSLMDSIVLAFIRHYRGLGFSGDEVMQLLCEDDPDARITYVSRKREEIAEQIRWLNLRQSVLTTLSRILTFMAGPKNTPVRIISEPYYFIRKADMKRNPLWKGLYREYPMVEYIPKYNAKTGLVELPDFFMYSGIALEENVVKTFSLTPPENSVYHPPVEKYVISWFLPEECPEKDLSEKVDAFFRHPPENEKILDDFILYMIPSGYKSEDAGFDVICFFEIET